MSDESFTQRQRHLRNLVVMAFADGQLGENEVDFFAEKCVELGLTEDDLTAAVTFGLSDDAALELPSDPVERDKTMRDLIRMMAADGVLDEGEKRLFALAAAKMGMTAQQVDSLVQSTLRSE